MTKSSPSATLLTRSPCTHAASGSTRFGTWCTFSLPHIWHLSLPAATVVVDTKGKGSGVAFVGGLASYWYSGEVDQPWSDVMSMRRMCLSEDPERISGGLKSMDAILETEDH